MERKQPVVKGIDERGEFIWGFVPMAYWQMAMFPLRYMGDFIAYWHKLKLFQEQDLECDGENAHFNSYVPWQVENKYAQAKKERHGKGD